MKKLMTVLLVLLVSHTFAQGNGDALQQAVTRLDQAKTVKDYEALEKTFTGIAGGNNNWLPYYYAALCNARIGFLLQDDGERIEPYSNRGEEQAKKAISLLDTAKQRQEAAEVYTVMSMVYRTKVFINPMTYGRRFGPLSDQYLKLARRFSPDNPRALYLAAWTKYYTPKLWGGDKDEAKRLARESLAKLGNSSGVAPHWGKAEDEALLAK
ncbi:hypothetical protein [Chitinophaga vietnamensis]|uniref:hypothetical protein n=1 Tax=Chitinophaga vietnamensis TaxID=2593957 RepID=UPI0011773F94|nr:hypothetical protein [Chitinophaga vietnamensis]